MINNSLKNNKGITMITLALAIIIMIVIVSTLVYNINTGIRTRALNDMYNDVQLLKDRVDIYYAKYGKLPVLSMQYTQTSNLQGLNVNDNDVYYVIDIEALDNITLTYGKGYETLKQNFESKVTDVYVVNEKSHTIYYIKGVQYEEKTYYTIPSQYSTITKPEWSDEYTQTKQYTDIEGNTAWIPKGFQVSLKDGETKISEGLVVRNAGDLNEFVWVPTDLVTYQTYDWNKGFAATSWTEYYTSDEAENTKIINEVTNSVNTYKGYYISRYEAGVTTKRTSKIETNQADLPAPIFIATSTTTPVYAYNYVDWNDAIYIGNNLYNKESNNVTSRLINARSWDTALKFIETVGTDKDSVYPTNSNGKGWFNDNTSNNVNYEIGKSVDLTNVTVPNRLKNIYDIAGNMWEWTADIYISNTTHRALRRGRLR